MLATELVDKREKVLASFAENPLLTLVEAAVAVNVPVSTVRSWVQNGAVNAVRVGRKIMLSASEVKRLRAGGFVLK